jgi:hypothetical protein
MIDISQVSSNIMMKAAYVSFSSHNPKWKYETIIELYNYIYHKTDQSQFNLLELEIKFGCFKFGGGWQTLQYIEDIFKLPSVRNDNSNFINFESKLSENNFYSLIFFLDKECEKNPEIRKIDPELYNEIIYTSGKRKSEVLNLRNKEKKTVIIKKDDKHHIQIRNSGADMRITICKEFPTDVTNEDVPDMYRDKFRMSYKFRFFRLDLTVVQSGKTLQEKNSCSNNYEVEFEFDEINFRAKEFRNFESFYRIIERYLENAFSIYESISKEFYSKFFSQSNKRESLFGDYIENVCK